MLLRLLLCWLLVLLRLLQLLPLLLPVLLWRPLPLLLHLLMWQRQPLLLLLSLLRPLLLLLPPLLHSRRAGPQHVLVEASCMPTLKPLVTHNDKQHCQAVLNHTSGTTTLCHVVGDPFKLSMLLAPMLVVLVLPLARLPVLFNPSAVNILQACCGRFWRAPVPILQIVLVLRLLQLLLFGPLLQSVPPLLHLLLKLFLPPLLLPCSTSWLHLQLSQLPQLRRLLQQLLPLLWPLLPQLLRFQLPLLQQQQPQPQGQLLVLHPLQQGQHPQLRPPLLHWLLPRHCLQFHLWPDQKLH
jgi:hypothetical protein